MVRYVWAGPDGTSIDLTDMGAGYVVTGDGTVGFESLSYTLTTTRYAGIDGETVNAVSADPNQPTIGLFVRASSRADLRVKVRGLVRAMRPKAGVGALQVTADDGATRTLNCYCIDGFAGSALAPAWYKAVLKFYAPDPWWLGDQRTISVGLGVGANFFPMPPLALAPSAVQGQFTVDLSDSDSPAFPVWTITGPGSSLVLTNNTTGHSLTVNQSLTAGQSLVIDTRPGSQSVRLGDGTNAMASVSGYPDLWPLIEDVNTVTAQLTGATVDSRIEGTYQRRYAGI